jgi:hypothetical protein
MLIDGIAIVLCLVLLVDGVAIVLYLVFSLTKYSAIFTEVEGDFVKNNNNQYKVVELGELLVAEDRDELDELVAAKGHID